MKRNLGRASRALVVGVAGLAVAALGHFHGHRKYLDRLDTDHTLFPPAPPSTWRAVLPVPMGARRTLLVVIDGLRDDVGDRLPAMRRLASDGVRRTLLASFPSYTFPGLKMLASGVPPAYSGTRMNSGRSPLHYETLVDVAAAAGVPVRMATDESVDFGQALDLSPRAAVAHDGLAQLAASAVHRELVFVHLGRVDEAGHRYGGSSREYLAAATAADTAVGELAAALDPARDLLLVVSDHGHLDRGGHGGADPEAVQGFFLAWGIGVRRGVHLPPGRLADVGATLALVAGLPPPQQNLGAPMIDILDLPPAEVARRLAPSWTQRAWAATRFAAPLAHPLDPSPLATRLAAGDPDAIPLATEGLAEDDRLRESIRRDELRRRMERRLPLSALVVLGLAAGLAMLHRRGVVALCAMDLLPLAVFSTLFAVGYVGLGYSFGWSLPHGYGGFLIETTLVGFLALAGGLVTVRVCARGRLVAASTVVVSACLAAYAVAAAVSGLDPAWLEGPRASFALVLVATFVFYAGGGFGLALIVIAARHNASSAGPHRSRAAGRSNEGDWRRGV